MRSGRRGPRRLLAGFEQRARAAAGTGRTFYDERMGWLVTTVGARGEDWGRVILVRDGAPAGTPCSSSAPRARWRSGSC